MYKAYKYRLYPTAQQADLINRHIGCCRFIYNLALETKLVAYAGSKINLTVFDLMKQLPDLKKELPWLKEVNSQSLQGAIRNLDVAYTAFFKGRANFPKYKSKHKGRQSFSCPQKVNISDDKLFIRKFKEGIRIVLHRPIKGEIRQATISRTPTGKYFASILCDTGEDCAPKQKVSEQSSVGVDLGIKSYLATSDGQLVDNPKHLRKALSKLKYTQRKYSKYRGKRTKHRLAALNEKISNKRKDFLHKTSTQLICENQTICVEDLNIRGMIKNHQLAQSITDVSWGMFVDMLEYKAEWYGRNIVKIGRFDPSSKMCSMCGHINKELTLKDREWACPSCGSVLDRDVNAARNIKSFALKKFSVERRVENQKELPTMVGALTSEAPSFR